MTLREPHPSIPRNPLLAEPLFLARYIERASTGTPDMAKLCAEADLAAPEFREAHGQFIQMLEQRLGGIDRQIPLEKGLPTQSGDPVERLSSVLFQGERSAGDLRSAIGIKHRPTFRENSLHPALGQELIEQATPEKPNSRPQKYRLTEKGRARPAGRKA